MSRHSAWVTIALGAWLGAACGSRSDLAVGERLGEADPEEVELVGAANGADDESDSMNGVGGMAGGGDPMRPSMGGVIIPDPPVIGPPPPMQPAPVWFPRGELRLRADELLRSAKALLGVSLRTEQRTDFEQERLIEKLSAGERANLGVSDEWLDEVLSQVTDEQLQVAMGCDADAGCSPEALTQFAARAWRKPLSDAEFAEIIGEFGTEFLSGAEGVRGFVRAVFGDANFALLSLMGEQVGGAHQLTDFELASRLSFQFTGGPPDAELWDVAAAGQLRDRDSRVKQASRLLSGPAGREYVGEWVAHWFGAVASEDTEHPLGAATLNGETQRLARDVLLDSQLPLQRLLDADYTFVNQELAEWYGLPDVGDGWSKVSLASTTRRGILHHASWLGQRQFPQEPHSPEGQQVPQDQHYGWRGSQPPKLICSALLTPPSRPSVSKLTVLEGTPRDQMEALTATPGCAVCHQVLDPVAFSFDHYDGWGQYRTTFSTGEPIDATGEVKMFNDARYEFDDSADFVTQLAASDAYLDCFRQVWVGSSAGLVDFDSIRDDSGSLESYLLHSKRASLFMDIALQFVGSEHYVNRR